ncbi:hypothetical protein B0T10DRAFT_411534 [Thelonectria olida]|uniref:Peptide hydrolase n=1 Tax=Thelonectria olida TaxID=1576542 RepID=A0A9P8VZ04_9HYPO|nr:hypothetical protein B0T10DRAFT_411534 [Thelonectria olida]
MVKLETLALLFGVGYAIAGALEQHPGSLPTRRDMLQARAKGLRLVKTSDEDAGVWMTEQEKFDKLISKKVGFMDITDTLELENLRLNSLASDTVTIQAIPSAPSHQSEAKQLIAKANIANLRTWANAMAAFYNRYYRGSYASTSATWMYNAVVNVTQSNSKITVTRYTHSYNQPSVIAKIPGSSSAVVIVSAHYDSIGSTTSGRAPGADDNASGVVVILEALRILAGAGYSPKNTLEFHFYSGEEGGLLGSRDIMQSYVTSGVNVLAVVNQDMTGYSPNNVIAVYTDYVDTTLTNFVKKLVPVYTDLPLSTDVCGYGCSDHASANSAGFPAAYVCDENMEDSSPYIHSASDAISTLSFEHILQHVKFTVGFLVEGSYF